MDQRFPKSYKLCSKKIIDQLFTDGKQVRIFPYLLYYKHLELDVENSFQLVISVPKRNFKKAHDRNKIKRQLREAIRKNKLILEDSLQSKQKQLALFLIYTNREAMEYTSIEAKVKKLFQALVNTISEEYENKGK